MIPLASIRAVVDYSWEKEEEDYEEMLRLGEIKDNDSRHIFTALKRVNAWLVQEELEVADDYEED